MAYISSGTFAAAMRTSIRRNLLPNLRAELKWNDPRLMDEGTFDQGSDTITFMIVPDLAVATTPLTEGTNPTAVALSMTTVTVSAAEYGNVVQYTNIAKIKTPIELSKTIAERLSRNAQVTIDQLVRDTVALSGTPVYAGTGAPANRPAIGAADLLRAVDLRRLYGKMRAASVPFFADGKYLLFTHPYVVYDLKTDDDTGAWTPVAQYTEGGRRDLISGEIGAFEGFRIISVSNCPTATSTVTVYQSFAFGGHKPWGAGSLDTLRTSFVPNEPSAYDPLGLNGYAGWHVMFGVAALSVSWFYRVETAATSLA